MLQLLSLYACDNDDINVGATCSCDNEDGEDDDGNHGDDDGGDSEYWHVQYTRMMCCHTCQTGSVCFPVLAVDRYKAFPTLSLTLYTATLPETNSE